MFPLYLGLVVEMEDHDHDIFQIPPVRMIPASNEAIIQSLKTSKLPPESFCSICMSEDDEDDDDKEEVEFSAMPCGHGFHHRCIVQWLNTSHMCPICRYTLPTTND
ncbi:hypothetical protein RIF29_26116 [Crotalaria pallida]|uniref:RING-type E3 ubiquitin transferase n=1 Tax=Crotalaria pallida TaxID=3830 RepID=A0AAN9ESC8_CROPI